VRTSDLMMPGLYPNRDAESSTLANRHTFWKRHDIPMIEMVSMVSEFIRLSMLGRRILTILVCLPRYVHIGQLVVSSEYSLTRDELKVLS
jgi:hypothetical protein